MRIAPQTIAIRLSWAMVVLVTIGLLAWLDHNRGGDMLKTYACYLASNHAATANSDVLIFGTSRSGAAFDPFYMESIFAQEDPDTPIKFQRFNVTGIDKVTSYHFLKHRIEQGTAPKVVVLGLSMRKKSPNAKRSINEKNTLRHSNLIPARELLSIHKQFDQAQKNPAYLDIMKTYINRYTALIYGFIKHPSPQYWSAASCAAPKEWARDTWPSSEHTAIGGLDSEIDRAHAVLEAYSDAADAAKEKMSNREIKKSKRKDRRKFRRQKKSKGKIYHAHDIYALDQIVTLAENSGSRVIITPLLNFDQRLSAEDVDELKELFPTTLIYDAVGEAGPILSTHWRNRAHLTKQGSVLTSALLAKVIAQELQR